MPNNNPGTIDLRGNPQVWSLDVQNYGDLNPNGTYDQTPVNMIYRTTGPNNAQKWQYFPASKEIKGMNDMCLEAGYANEGDYARVQTCSNNSNQKWSFNSNKTLSIDYTNRCLQYENQYPGVNNFHLVVRNCTAGGNQIWDGNGMNVPAANITQYVLLRDFNGGNNSIWKFANTAHPGDTAFPNYVPSEWKVAGFGDFNADGYQDILWRNSNSGENVLWEMQNGAVTKDWGIISTVGLDFSVAGIGDFNGDGYADILWRNTAGVNVIWNYNRNVKIGDSGNFSNVSTDWKVASVADFNNDGKADIFWRNNNGTNVVWNMNNSSVIQNGADTLDFMDSGWYVAGVADFNNDQKKDILWRNNNGTNNIWNMNNRTRTANWATNTVGNDFIVGGLGDFNQDGKADIFWRNQNGQQNVIWTMDNATVSVGTQVGTTGTSITQVKGIFAK